MACATMVLFAGCGDKKQPSATPGTPAPTPDAAELSRSLERVAQEQLVSPSLTHSPVLVMVKPGELAGRTAELEKIATSLGGSWAPLPEEGSERKFLVQVPEAAVPFYQSAVIGAQSTPPPPEALSTKLEYLTVILRVKAE